MSGANKGTGRKLIIVIIILLLIIAGLLIYIFTGSSKKGADSSSPDITTSENVKNNSNEQKDDEQQTAYSTDEAQKDNLENQSSDKKQEIYVEVSCGNSWEANGTFSGQLDAKIINKSASDIKGWSLELDMTKAAKLDSSWNGNFEVKNAKLTITPVDYNETVAASGELSDIGFILNVSSKNDLQTIAESAKLFVNGKEQELSANKPEEETTENTVEKTEDIKDTEAVEETEDSKVTEAVDNESSGETPFDKHGRLSVSGTDLVDKDGNKIQLKGVSTHGIAWFPDYVNEAAFKSFRDDWKANIIRLAMYTYEDSGYCSGGDQSYLKELVDKGVNAATELGMYVIIDWHVLRDCNPQTYKEEAKAFFDEMSKKYSDYDNVLYEICNEPNGGTTWSDVKEYAEEVIPVIRANAENAIIIIGTPNWSQDVDVASNDPVSGYDNLIYAIHFYAATHTDSIRSKVDTAIANGLPVFVSEFSICDASGNGAIDYEQADKWFELINKYNLSYCGWNVSNKDETSSLIKASCDKLSDWSDEDLSDTGIWLKNQIKGVK